MIKKIKIKQCYYSCPFFDTSMDGMECNHPYWKDKGAYENMIITQDNSRNGKMPEKCPLKKEQLTIIYKLNISDVISSKNMWLEKLKKDLLQNKYNLKKVGLYNRLIKEGIENLLESLKDYDM
jgi:hypothetical protein